MFILLANMLGLLPLALVGVHPFTFTSHFSATAVLAVMTFSIVLIVGFWRHGFHFFSLFVPHGTPVWLLWLIPVIELVSASARDAGGNALDTTFYSANSAGVSADAPQLTPVGAVINPDGTITVGHIDPATGQVHVATRPQTGATKDDGTIFGFSPLMLGVIAVGAIFLLKK